MTHKTRDDIRNVAIIAHVDHGKTTLVDGLLKQSNIFRANQAVGDLIMDSNDLEREKGITILAKNTAVMYRGVKINIIDTPGHADFSGEVERVLNMADGCLLLVDAVDGPMPQTKFVLRQALRRGHRAILVVNKVDRPQARPNHVLNETFDLFLDLGATEEQAEFPTLYTNAILGTASADHRHIGTTLEPEFDAIVDRIPGPDVDPAAPAQLLVTTTTYDDYIGRVAGGRLHSGTLRKGQAVARIDHHGGLTPAKITQLFTFNGLAREEVDQATAGDIVAVAGVEAGIGDTIADAADPRPLPPIRVEEPTLRMSFSVNNSPFGARGKVRHQPQASRAPLRRARAGRRAPRRRLGLRGHARGERPRRAAPRDPHRDDASRGLRVPGLAPRGDPQGDRRGDAGAVRAAGDRGRAGRAGFGCRARGAPS